MLETNRKSEEITLLSHILMHLQTTLSRTAMFWLRHFITSISLDNTYKEGKLKIVDTN